MPGRRAQVRSVIKFILRRVRCFTAGRVTESGVRRLRRRIDSHSLRSYLQRYEHDTDPAAGREAVLIVSAARGNSPQRDRRSDTVLFPALGGGPLGGRCSS